MLSQLHWSQHVALGALVVLICVRIWNPPELRRWTLYIDVAAGFMLGALLFFVPRARRAPGAPSGSPAGTNNPSAPEPGDGAKVDTDVEAVDELVDELDGVGVGDLHDRVERWRKRTKRAIEEHKRGL